MVFILIKMEDYNICITHAIRLYICGATSVSYIFLNFAGEL